MRWLLFSLCYFFLLTVVNAQQSPRDLKKTGEAFFKKYQYHEAFEQLQDYYQLKPNDNDIWQLLGIAAYHTNNLAIAKQLLSQVIQNSKSPDPDAILFLAKTYQIQHQFSKAATTYKQFLRSTKSEHPLQAMVKDELRRCSYALRKDFVDPSVIVENLGTQINGKRDDFGPILSPNYQDRLYFSSVRASNLGGRRNDAGLQDNDTGFFRADMYRTEIRNGNWMPVTPMTALLNSSMNDIILDFSEDGQVMYYFKGLDMYAGEAFVDTFKTLDERTLFSSHLDTPYEPEAGDTSPFFYDDNTLIFASRRDGGYGGLDLYWTEKRDGIWVAPRNLGSTINSAYDETTPFLAADGQTLYFSSNHSKRSLGDYDIFQSNFSSTNARWSTPQNLGLPINSAGDDRYFRLAKDGQRAFFSSHRNTSIGGQDIYLVYFKDYQIAQQKTPDSKTFNILIANAIATTSQNSIQEENENTITYNIEPLLFEDENDILNYKNTKQLNQLTSILNQNPNLKVLITAHSDGSEPEKFDLFFSIKRAEIVSQYLLDNGISNEQIILNGVGANYPLAKEILDNKPNPIGLKLNRRITLEVINNSNNAVNVVLKYPVISPIMTTLGSNFHKQTSKGLVYRVQIAVSPQMYNGNLINNYPHPLIEKQATNNLYQYTVGRYNTYSSARELQKELVLNGVSDAFVVACLDGLRLSLEDASVLAKDYPDLQQFITEQIKE